MSDNEKTDPNFSTRLKDGTAKADPYADRLLEAAKGSAWTPWIIVALVLACVAFGVWLTR